ncbi:MAG: helix-turn-helix domain-containing protein [Kofleriaceae bacterium]
MERRHERDQAGPATSVAGSPDAAATATRAGRLALAAWLRDARLDRGLTLADVAAVTKIPSRTLDLLEAGRFEDLPADVFVRGFVRNYARCVGLPEDEALERYLGCGRLTTGAVGERAAAPRTPSSAVRRVVAELAPTPALVEEQLLAEGSAAVLPAAAVSAADGGAVVRANPPAARVAQVQAFTGLLGGRAPTAETPVAVSPTAETPVAEAVVVRKAMAVEAAAPPKRRRAPRKRAVTAGEAVVSAMAETMSPSASTPTDGETAVVAAQAPPRAPPRPPSTAPRPAPRSRSTARRPLVVARARRPGASGPPRRYQRSRPRRPPPPAMPCRRCGRGPPVMPPASRPASSSPSSCPRRPSPSTPARRRRAPMTRRSPPK